MLLTLLPFTAWADDIDLSNATVTITIVNGTDARNYTGVKDNRPTIYSVQVGDENISSADVDDYFTIKYYKKNSQNNYVANSQSKNAGSYKLSLVGKDGYGFTGEINANSRVDYTIAKASLDINVKDKTRAYGANSDPAFLATDVEAAETSAGQLKGTDTFDGLVFKIGETAVPRENGTTVGSGYAYDFSANATAGYITTDNYVLTVKNSPVLNITKKNLHATVGDAAFFTITYGDATPALTGTNAPAITYTDGDFVGEDATSFTATGTLAYDWSAYTGNTAPVNANYLADGSAKINATTSPTYALTFTGLSHANYNIVFNNAELKIKQKTLSAAAADGFTITPAAEDVDLTYNGGNQTPEMGISFKGTALTATEFTPSYTYSADNTNYAATTEYTKAGYYKVTLEAAKDQNGYTGNFSGVIADVLKYQIKPKNLTVYVDVPAKNGVYNGQTVALTEANGFKIQYSGKVDETAFTNIALKYSYMSDADDDPSTPDEEVLEDNIPAAAGTFTVKAVYTNESNIEDNYAPNCVASTWTVDKRPLMITATSTDKTFGDADPTFEYTFNYPTAENLNVGMIKDNGTGDAHYTNSDEDKIRTAATAIITVTRTDESEEVGNNYELTVNYDDEAENILTNNYSIQTTPGTFQIKGAGFTLYAKNVEIVYGTSPEDLKAKFDYGKDIADALGADVAYEVYKPTATGLVKVEEADYTKLPVLTAPAKYTIKIVHKKEYATGNYDGNNITYNDGELVVTKRSLTITPAELTLNVGATNTTMRSYETGKVTLNGLVSGDEVAYTLDFNLADTYASADAQTGVKTLLTAAAEYNDGTNGTGVFVAGIKAAAEATVAGKDNGNYQITAGTAKLKVIAGALVILDRTDANMWAKLQAASHTTASTINFSNEREFAAKQWNVMVLPFEVNVADLSAAFGYALVDRLDRKNSTSSGVRFVIEMDKIPANEPFLIKTQKYIWNTTSAEKLTAAGITAADVKLWNTVELSGIVKPSKEEAVITNETGDVSFKGLYEAETFESDFRTVRDGVWMYGDGNKTISMFNGYYIAGLNARVFVEDLDNNGATVIREIGAENGKAYNVDGWYTLNGVKLQGMPTEKGIYINNGKKVVIK